MWGSPPSLGGPFSSRTSVERLLHRLYGAVLGLRPCTLHRHRCCAQCFWAPVVCLPFILSFIYHNISMVPFPKRDPSLSEDKWLAKFQSWDLDPDLWLKSLIAFHSRGRGRFMSKDKQPITRWVYLKRQTRIVVVARSQRHSDSCFIRQDGGGPGWGGDGMGTTHIRAL